MTDKQAEEIIYQLRRIADNLADLVVEVERLTGVVKTA